jgi:UV DNA damage endonuclease
MLRLGLCCLFKNESIVFHTTTAKSISKYSSVERLEKLSDLCLGNAESLFKAIEYCVLNKIGCFRVSSRIFPLKTHPDFGYKIDDLKDYEKINNVFIKCRKTAEKFDIRLTFHPDQFVVLSSPDILVVKKSIQELEYQAQISESIGADVINIHAGGVYGDKKSALGRLAIVLSTLDSSIRRRLTLENDDRSYTPSDLLPFCKKNKVPFVYDIHHHRCLTDDLSIENTTKLALETWDREPLFHMSSPKYGFEDKKCRNHSDYISIEDFPLCWKKLDITVEIEAKAKELAVKKIRKQINKEFFNEV